MPVLLLGVCLSDTPHHRPAAVMCKLYKIRCNPMHPLYGAQPGPNVTVRVTSGALHGRTSVYLFDSSLYVYSSLSVPLERSCAPVAAGSLVLSSPQLHRAIRGGYRGVFCGVTASQLDLPSLMPLS